MFILSDCLTIQCNKTKRIAPTPLSTFLQSLSILLQSPQKQLFAEVGRAFAEGFLEHLREIDRRFEADLVGDFGDAELGGSQ